MILAVEKKGRKLAEKREGRALGIVAGLPLKAAAGRAQENSANPHLKAVLDKDDHQAAETMAAVEGSLVMAAELAASPGLAGEKTRIGRQSIIARVAEEGLGQERPGAEKRGESRRELSTRMRQPVPMERILATALLTSLS